MPRRPGDAPAFPASMGALDTGLGLTKRELIAAIATAGALSDTTISLDGAVAVGTAAADKLLAALDADPEVKP